VERVIGIELGHTNCRVAWATEDAEPQILSNRDNQRLTPTAAALHPDGQWLFGAGARAKKAAPHA
jgi:molecular chaperone DnaK (HSP70)